MRDYITTAFNLVVGLIDADKIVWLALIALGLILVWQLISLLSNFYRKFARKCRTISKFLSRKGLSATNYNQFLALVAKMPQEFIRGYKTFEHASYGLPSDYIKRFDSIDVELNGGLLNHGKSLVKAFIYGWTIILFVLQLALVGSDVALTGLALADALLVPVLFLVIAKVLYFIFNAIKQQQYRTAVDEFNEMLDIMDDKIENNDNLPGPDILAEAFEDLNNTGSEGASLNNNSTTKGRAITTEELNELYNTAEQKEEIQETQQKNDSKVQAISLAELQAIKAEMHPESTVKQNAIEEEPVAEQEEAQNKNTETISTVENVTEEVPTEQPEEFTEAELVDEVNEDFVEDVTEVTDEEENLENKPKLGRFDWDLNSENEESVEDVKIQNVQEDLEEESVPEQEVVEVEDAEEQPEEFTQEELIEEVNEESVENDGEEQTANQEESTEKVETIDWLSHSFENDSTEEKVEEQPEEKIAIKPKRETKKQEEKDVNVEQEKRGRGRPKKVAEGELVITNDKQFEEVLQRAEKLMRKSEEALSSSQAKRVEKALKELVDAMTKYKEEH